MKIDIDQQINLIQWCFTRYDIPAGVAIVLNDSIKAMENLQSQIDKLQRRIDGKNK